MVAALGLTLAGCAGREVDDGEAAVTSASEGSTSDGSTSDGSTTTDTTSTTTMTDDGADEWDDSSDSPSDSGGSFYAGASDVNQSCGTMCNPWVEDDCPEGEKCTAVACEVGSSSWDSNVCRPIGGDGAPGDECMGAGVDGNDDCGPQSMCWSPNPDTGLGTCVSFCEGSSQNPACPAETVCGIYNDGVLPLCLPTCDPLAPDCPNPNDLCLPAPQDEGFLCGLDASGGMAPYGTPCSFVNSCNPGLVCVDAAVFPAGECRGGACCMPLCDLSAAEDGCPAISPMLECIPYSEDPPPAYVDVGLCSLPAP